MFTLADQPQSIGKVLDSGFRLYGAGFKKFIGLAALYAIVMIVPALFVPLQARPPGLPVFSDPQARIITLTAPADIIIVLREAALENWGICGCVPHLKLT